ncbi:hypothetical protein J4234_01050 [Candidatus Woesearchaeota archaeon]|nr:hypothetical protein [Candidatus Woesearchaeota archaeon]
MPAQETSLPPPPKKHEGILKFGHAQQQEAPDFSGITTDVNTLSRRLRLLEEGFTNLRRFFQVTEENIIAKNKHFSAEIKTLTSDVNEVRKEIQEMKDKLILVIIELQSVARKQEVKVLERYINLWNPIKFVTQNEVEQIINEVLDKKQQ